MPTARENVTEGAVYTSMSAGAAKQFAIMLGKFSLGDLVDSFGCESGRSYMPGTGMIITIRPDEERPFICEHNDRVYRYKKSEIEHTDLA
jgi:hypothetical protein